LKKNIIAANPEFTLHDISVALLVSLGDVLISTECPDCRRLSKKSIEKMLPPVLRHAMLPQLNEHVH
jgi:hypothetical protein